MSTMSIENGKAAQDMTKATTSKLQDLIYSLRNSVEHHREAADRVNDRIVAKLFRDLANEREVILETIGGFVSLAKAKPDESGSFLGKLKTCWTSFRAGLNDGDATVVLIEAERAEDTLMAQFKEVLPEISGNPINDKLLSYFEKVKAGHDRVLKMRNQYQAQA